MTDLITAEFEFLEDMVRRIVKEELAKVADRIADLRCPRCAASDEHTVCQLDYAGAIRGASLGIGDVHAAMVADDPLR